MNAIELALFSSRLATICEEMGAALRFSALSPNIKDREDYSCAIFDAKGELVAQAAHIPVHLGSMAFCMRDIVARFNWRNGDTVVFNDPFLGGTHLPDITLVQPLFDAERLAGFVAIRAHHADIGGKSAGSMGLETRLEDEGLVIPPQHWFSAYEEQEAFRERFFSRLRNPKERFGDLAAQRGACMTGLRRLRELAEQHDLVAGFATLLDISAAYGSECIKAIPDGIYSFEDAIEDDGHGNGPLPIRLSLTVDGERVIADFSGTAARCAGPLNAPLPVTAAAVYYVFRCLMPANTPQTSAIFRPITITVPESSLLNPGQGAAVAAGNVETSQRIVDVVLGALAKAIPERIPAASQGTMNNVIFGGVEQRHTWVYYETIGGGMGAHADSDGLSALQCHMTNTKNTSIEVLEMHYPLRILRYAIRRGSGGSGRHRGGDGTIREWEALAECELSLLSERRSTRPYGLAGGGPGSSGRNRIFRNGEWQELPAKVNVPIQSGERLLIETPGGGGYGEETDE